MDKLQIEAIGPGGLKLSRELGGPLAKGDRRTFTEPADIEYAKKCIERGWAKDTSGQIPTGQRKIRGEVLIPHDSEVSHG